MTERKPHNVVSSPAVVLREEFDQWAVLFNPDTADAVGINPVGVAVWKLLDGTRDESALVETLGESFDEIPGAATQQVHAFVEQLLDLGFAGYADTVETG